MLQFFFCLIHKENYHGSHFPWPIYKRLTYIIYFALRVLGYTSSMLVRDMQALPTTNHSHCFNLEYRNDYLNISIFCADLFDYKITPIILELFILSKLSLSSHLVKRPVFFHIAIYISPSSNCNMHSSQNREFVLVSRCCSSETPTGHKSYMLSL